MKERSRLIPVVTCTIAIGGLLGVCMPAAADWDAACSNRTIRGDYGFSIEGLALPGGPVALPMRGVALTSFDGKGGLTQVDHVVFNGMPPAQDWTPGKGTYTVNPDCTGSFQVNVPSTGDIVNVKFVVVRDGKEIHTVVTAPFNGPPRTVTSTGIRVD